MIVVSIWKIKKTLTQKSWVKKIKITGHASTNREDLFNPLCLGVSSVTLGTVNAFNHHFLRLKPLVTIKTKEKGHLEFLVKKANSEVELIFRLMIVQLETVASYFQKGLKIVYQQSKN